MFVVIVIADGDGGTNYAAYGPFHTTGAAKDWAVKVITPELKADWVISKIFSPIDGKSVA